MTNEGYRDRAREIDSDPDRRPVRPGLIIGLVALVLFLVFIFQNTEETTVTFLWMELTLAEWIYFVVIFLLGAIVGWVGRWRQVQKAGKKTKKK